MKTKGSSVKPSPRFRHMLRNVLPFTIPLQNEANGENSWDSDVLNEPRDDGGFIGHSNDEMVPDSFEERGASSPSMAPQCFRTRGVDRNLDILLEGDPCILCDEGANGHVLFCSEVGCPFALDENCMNVELDNNDVKTFYCPYCWYKRLKLRSKALREKAIAAEKSLSSYLDTMMVDSSHNHAGVERYKADLSLCTTNIPQQQDKMDIGEINLQHFNKDQVNSGGPFKKDDHGNEKTFEYRQNEGTEVDTTNNQFDFLVDEENRGRENLDVTVEDDKEVNEDRRQEGDESKQVTDVETSQYIRANDLVDAEKSKLVGVDEDEQEVSVGEEKATNRPDEEGQKTDSAQPEKLVERNELHDVLSEEEENSTDGSVAVEQMCVIKATTEEQKMVQRKKQLSANEEESSLSSTASSNKESNDQSRSRHLRLRRGKQIIRSRISSPLSEKSVLPGASSVGNGRNSGKKVDTPSSLSAKRKVAAVSSERRKKLFWTPEEEETLRKSVKKFSVEAKKNIPWSKILESGKDVFNETRTPIDLKDKWRNMTTR